jgi:predicted nucleic acid-binding protein
VIFVDSWAWIALAVVRDQYHAAAKAQHTALCQSGLRYVTTNFVLAETITYLFGNTPVDDARAFVDSVLGAIDTGAYSLIDIDSRLFRLAWQMRWKYRDKPDISFVDLTSMVVMQDLGITDVFTGDAHFRQVGPGFRLVP